jgi:hypothetical protein
MYQVLSDTIIIHPDFNEPLNVINELDKLTNEKTKIKSEITTIIFSNYKNFTMIESTENKCKLNKQFIRNRFNHPVEYLPETITHIVFGGKFNNKINLKNNTLQFIEFYGEYNYPLDGLPDSIIEINICGWDFNQPINKLPYYLLCLNFLGASNKFNKPINCSNSNLQKLNLKSSEFNQPIDNLPSNLKILILPNKFNQPVENLPCTIEEIYFGQEFNQSLDYLPNSIVELFLHENFSQSLDNLPNSIKKLSIRFNGSMTNIKSLLNLPKSIEEILIDFNSTDINNFTNKIKIKIAHTVKTIYLEKKMIKFFIIGDQTQYIFSK